MGEGMMTEKQCANCGELNQAENNFCSNCGANEFKDTPSRLAARPADGRVPSSAVRISTGRIVLVTVLSAGLYLLYWFYLTWKQLASETTEENYPVWHALTLLVPIYALFRMYAHVRVIGELAARQGVTSMTPGLAVVLLIVSSALGWSSLRITDYVLLIVLGLLNTVVTTTLVVTAQGGLNSYWEKVRQPDNLTDARVGMGEVVLVVLGILVWILTFRPVLI